MYAPAKDGIDKTALSVTYTEAKPPDGLCQLAHCFWEIKTEAPLSDDFLYHILPDACVNILFNQIDTRIAAITALHTMPKTLNLGKAFHYVGIQLLPGVWKGDPNEILDGFVDKPYAGNLPLTQTNADLVPLDFLAKQTALAKFLGVLVEENLVSANSVTNKILRNIECIYSVADMANLVNMSSRQLQRTLKQTTGFSPHDLLKILRVQQSFKKDYLDHYADQSHFIHSFRKITGYTPTRYAKKFDV